MLWLDAPPTYNNVLVANATGYQTKYPGKPTGSQLSAKPTLTGTDMSTKYGSMICKYTTRCLLSEPISRFPDLVAFRVSRHGYVSSFSAIPWRARERSTCRLICDIYTAEEKQFEGVPRFALERTHEKCRQASFMFKCCLPAPHHGSTYCTRCRTQP